MHELSKTIQPGLTHEREWIVIDSMLYSPGGDPARATLSSPSMINEMETTAMLGLDPRLPDGGFTVGFHVDIKHVAAAPPGSPDAHHRRTTRGIGNSFPISRRSPRSRLGPTDRHRDAPARGDLPVIGDISGSARAADINPTHQASNSFHIGFRDSPNQVPILKNQQQINCALSEQFPGK